MHERLVVRPYPLTEVSSITKYTIVCVQKRIIVGPFHGTLL
jgi:hypothetical protein